MPFLLLMPSYNQSHYIVDAVRSILAQDDPDWELWIVDNSSDQTPEVMRQFADPRIRFHHIAARMDPGTCLNWMLERAVGRDFSYVHTDNNLHPSYVRRLRAALESRPLGLAYCDMRTIDEHGRYTNVYRRGHFDLPRLLSVDTLGVPFAATTELAKLIGGFSERDFADDVCFCVSAYGVAEYQYIPQPLLDYRLHSHSRTEESGGLFEMQRLFARLMPRIVPVLRQRKVDSLAVMASAIRQGLDDLDLYIEDIWHRRLSKWASVWWDGPPRVDHFFFMGLLNIPGFSLRLGRPRRRFMIRKDGKICAAFLGVQILRLYFLTRKRDVRRQTKRLRDMILSWATMALDADTGGAIAFRVVSLDFRTVWAARQLELILGWRPLLDPRLPSPLRWLRWGTATGLEPALDCSQTISFRRQ